MAWERVRASYDHVAGKYEARFLAELENKPRDRELLEAFATSASEPVVEIGCGPGQIGTFVRERGRFVVGVDLSPEMASLAARRLNGSVVADMRALPIATGVVGGLLAFYSVIHVQRAELDAVLHEFHRVLRPGGRMLLSAHEGAGDVELDEFLGEPVPIAATFFALDELVAACHTAGLAVVLAERRAPYPSESETFRLYVEAVAGA